MGKTYKSLSDIKPDKDQPRKKTGFGKEEIRELADSIKEVGVVVPILIQQDGTIIDGERRYRASKLLGLKDVPVIYDNNLSGVKRLEYQLICSLNSTSCAEEEIAPKIKEYIDASGYTEREAAQRLGKSHGYIGTMVKSLANLNKEEKDIIKLWRETKGEKGIAPSNLAELKQNHPEKKEEIIQIAKEELISRSDIRQIAKGKKEIRELEETKERYNEIQEQKSEELKIVRSQEIIDNLRTEIVGAERDLSRFIHKVKIVRFNKLSWKDHKEQSSFAKFIESALGKAQRWVSELERIRMEVGI